MNIKWGQLTLTIRQYFSEPLVHGLALTNSQMDVSHTPVTRNAWSSSGHASGKVLYRQLLPRHLLKQSSFVGTNGASGFQKEKDRD